MENNNIKLIGTIKNIEPSHTSNDKQYMKAIVEVQDGNKVYNIPIKYREDTFDGSDNTVSIIGNLRSYSKQLYVYTRFDPIPSDVNLDTNSDTLISGNIVKIDAKYKSIIVNVNNTYVPVKTEKEYNIGDNVIINGKLIERRYSKRDTSEQFSTFEVIEL